MQNNAHDNVTRIYTVCDKNGKRILAIGSIAGVDIPLGKQVKDAGLDVEAELVFPPCRQDRVRGNTNCNPNPNHKYYELSQPNYKYEYS